MAAKVTQQDIADTLGLSRNTVSKALKGDPVVDARTVRSVQEAAIRMGYCKFEPNPQEEIHVMPESAKTISLLAPKDAVVGTFWSLCLHGIDEVVRGEGYLLNINIVDSEESLDSILSVKPEGIIMMGVLSKQCYHRLEETGIPMVVLDSFITDSDAEDSRLGADAVYAQNSEAVRRLTKMLVSRGASRIGYVGERYLMQSYYERWNGFRTAMYEEGLKIDREVCILPDSDFGLLVDHLDYVEERIRSMSQLPQAFVCGYDRLAIKVVQTLLNLGLHVPEDVMVTGFDDIPEAAVISPTLTTARVDKRWLGKRVAMLLFERMENPEKPIEIVRVTTEIVERGSTCRN